MGKIFYIMGKSASGKDRIYSILSKDESLGLKRLVLYTTRPIRAGEENGREYYFTDENKLEEFRKTNRLMHGGLEILLKRLLPITQNGFTIMNLTMCWLFIRKY